MARKVGFDLCGIAAAVKIEPSQQRFFAWLDQGMHGEMSYLSRNPKRRTDPSLVLPGARSVIMLGLNYYQPRPGPLPNGHGQIARYAVGQDYHAVIEKLLHQLIGQLPDVHDGDKAGANYRAYVDYGPLLERSYGEQAGLGYIGRNSMLINRLFGSYFFLAGIITTLQLEPDNPAIENHGRCGECNRCVEACPTQAILPDGVIDARRCISYLTIERPEEISAPLATRMGDWLFGCDICQEVCPHNQRAQPTTHRPLLSDSGMGHFLPLDALSAWGPDSEEVVALRNTPLARPGLVNLQRSAQIVRRNQSSRKTGDGKN